MRALVIEDSATVLSMIQHVLQAHGHEVVTAKDGLEGIEKAYQALPDYVISDIEMPGMNGWQVIRFLKSDDAMKAIPVILMTTRTASTARLFSRMAGADYYLTKPFAPEALIDIVKKIVPSKSKPLQKGVQLDKEGIILRINDLLDKELLRTSIFNEVAKLSKDLQNLPRTCVYILKVLEDVLGLEVGAVLIRDERMIIYVAKKISEECLKQFKGKMIQQARQVLHWEVRAGELKIDRFGKRLDAEGKPLQAFHVLPLEEIGAIVGAGSTATASFHFEDVSVADSVTSGLSMVIQNALLHKKTQAMAITDGLTLLFTHRHLQESLAREIYRAQRYRSRFSILLLDIDDFKKTNDTYGHLFGDQVLRELADILRNHVRDTDVVGRYGGEEFLVILSETEREGAMITSERIRKAVEEHAFVWEGEKLHVTVSGGLATFPDDALLKRDLIEAADKALYRAKTLGKNRIEVAMLANKEERQVKP